jgi:hypothetical protein
MPDYGGASAYQILQRFGLRQTGRAGNIHRYSFWLRNRNYQSFLAEIAGFYG